MNTAAIVKVAKCIGFDVKWRIARRALLSQSVVMSKALAILSLIALVVHGALTKQPNLQSVTTSLALVSCFAVCAVVAVREWFEKALEA